MKNRIFITIAFLILAAQLFSQTQEKIPWPSLADSPWPVARGDVQGTGRSEYVGPAIPKVLFKQTYPFGFTAGPVIGKEGQLYFGTFAANFSTNENYFYSADSFGNQIWRFKTNNWVANSCAPVVALDGTIYFGTQGPDPSYLYALNCDGTLKWKFESHSPIENENVVLDKLGNIYVGNKDSLFSFSAEGNVRFQLAIPGILGTALVFSPSGDTLYVTSVYRGDGSNYIHHLYSVSTSGEIYWKREFQNLATSMAVDNTNNIYLQGKDTTVADRDALFCLNPDGSVKWYYDEEANADGYFGGPTIDSKGNIIFFGGVKDGGTGIISLDYLGNLNWIYEFEFEDWFDFGYIVIDHGLVCDSNGTIYAASGWGEYLYAISSEGELLWKLRLKDYYVTAGPVIGEDGIIYLGMHKSAFENNLVENLWVIGEESSGINDDETTAEFELHQNYPNPFNPTTRIIYQVASIESVTLKVYDILGREIATLLNEVKHPGNYELEFDASDLPSGVYFYRLNAGGFSESKKMILLR